MRDYVIFKLENGVILSYKANYKYKVGMIKMRKIVLVIASLLIASAMLCNNNNTKVKQKKQKNDYYPMITIVREIDNKNDIVTVENNDGELFQFIGIEDWQINDICSLMLDNNGTENIYDDIIIKTIYNGNINYLTR